MPRFRRRVVLPALSLGDPHWADDAGFDIARHVHALKLAAPGGDAELRELAGVLLSTPLDPRRPLWRLNLVSGVGDGFALVGQAHHALVDGLAAVEIATLLLDVRGAPRRRRDRRTGSRSPHPRRPARSAPRCAAEPPDPRRPARR